MTSDLKLKPSDVLAKAADLIEPEGKWRQHSARGPGGSMCIAEALSVTAPGSMVWGDLLAPLKKATGGRAIIDWNDARGRTQAEAVRVLRKASALARSEGC